MEIQEGGRASDTALWCHAPPQQSLWQGIWMSGHQSMRSFQLWIVTTEPKATEAPTSCFAKKFWKRLFSIIWGAVMPEYQECWRSGSISVRSDCEGKEKKGSSKTGSQEETWQWKQYLNDQKRCKTSFCWGIGKKWCLCPWQCRDHSQTQSMSGQQKPIKLEKVRKMKIIILTNAKESRQLAKRIDSSPFTILKNSHLQ